MKKVWNFLTSFSFYWWLGILGLVMSFLSSDLAWDISFWALMTMNMIHEKDFIKVIHLHIESEEEKNDSND